MENKLYYYRAVVREKKHVYDGDTLKVSIDLGLHAVQTGVKIRLLGINAPELKQQTLDQARVARDYLRGLVLGRELIVMTKRTGFYHRWLAIVWVKCSGKGWICVNDALVAAGHAVRY